MPHGGHDDGDLCAAAASVGDVPSDGIEAFHVTHGGASEFFYNESHPKRKGKSRLSLPIREPNLKDFNMMTCVRLPSVAYPPP